ncbi:MAG TPA: transcription termination/antitermination NusG family protein [Pyrinomonadaceae bacterium]
MIYSEISNEGDVPCWYVVQTKPQQEERAESNLNAWRVKTFLPKIRQRREHPFGGAPSYHIKPLFTRYLFAHFKANELLHKVSYTRGVHNVVSFSGWPASVDDEVIELLREQSDADGCVRVGQDLKAGDRVMISSGPFRNFIGIFQSTANDRERVAILLTAVSSLRHVIVDRELVRKLD